MDIVAILARCIAIERNAAAIYERLAARFAHDAELGMMWSAMAQDERAHASSLERWYALAEQEPPEQRGQATGFERDVEAVEGLLAETLEASSRVASLEEAFALALALETSEIDTIYITLLRSSPLACGSEANGDLRCDTSAHHATLVQVVQRRSQDGANLLRAALLAVRDRDP